MITKENIYRIFILSILFLLFFYVGISNFILFHTVAKIFNAVIEFMVLFLAVNALKPFKNSAIIYLGISFGSVGIFDILSALCLKGVNVLPYADANASYEFWMLASYFESFSVLIFMILFIKNKNKILKNKIMIYSSIVTAIFIYITLETRVFSLLISNDWLIIKKLQFIIFICVFLASVMLLLRNKQHFDKSFSMKLLLSLGTNIISQIFLFANAVTNIESLTVIGIIAKVYASYFIYLAVVKSYLKDPYKLLYKTINEKNYEIKNVNDLLGKENTKLKSLEKVISSNEQCIMFILNNSSTSIFIHSHGRFLSLNEDAAKLLGFSSISDLEGRELTDFVPEKYKSTYIKWFSKYYSGEKVPMYLMIHAHNKNNELLDLKCLNQSLVYKGESVILSIVHNRTYKREVKKLKEDVKKNKTLLNESLKYNRLITEFIANISHEIRTPLNIISSSLQLLQIYHGRCPKCPNAKKISEYHEIMRNNCFRLMKLSNNFIDMSKIESGFCELKLENVDIISFIENISMSVVPFMESRGLKLIFDTDSEEKIMAVDTDKTERILLNLLSNAAKFTKPGGNVYVNLEDKEDKIVIIVKDTGIGIPKDKLDIIFKRFRQVDNTFTRNHEGSGLGLSLVKSLVEMQDGKIYVESSVNIGTRFIVELPAKKLGNDVPKYTKGTSQSDRIKIEFSDL